MTNLVNNFGEGEAKIGGNSVKLIQKYIFLFNFVANVWTRGANWSSENCKGGVLMFQGQVGEIPILSLGKLGLFLVLALFSTRLFQKLGTSTHLKTTFSNRYGAGL